MHDCSFLYKYISTAKNILISAVVTDWAYFSQVILLIILPEHRSLVMICDFLFLVCWLSWDGSLIWLIFLWKHSLDFHSKRNQLNSSVGKYIPIFDTIKEHSHMTSYVLGLFLTYTYLNTVIRYLLYYISLCSNLVNSDSLNLTKYWPT